MKFSIKALVNAATIVGGGSVFLMGVVNMIWPNYAVAFLQLLDSIYPGYHATGSFSSVMIATLYAAVDSAICAAVFGWLYNRFVGVKEESEEQEG